MIDWIIRWLIPRSVLSKCVCHAWAIVTVEAYPTKTPDEITVFQTMAFLTEGKIDL